MTHQKNKKQIPLLKQERRADRFDTELPVDMGGIQGLTRNICATGIYFETEMAPTSGSRVQFTVEVNIRGEKSKMVCDGEVVRVEHHDGKVGIAVKLVSSFFSNATEVIVIKPTAPTEIT